MSENAVETVNILFAAIYTFNIPYPSKDPAVVTP